MPQVTVIMTTYAPDEARARCAKIVVESLDKYLGLSEGEGGVALHIADDGSPEKYTASLVNYAREFFNVSYTVAPRRGIGGSLNLALQHLHWRDVGGAGDGLYMYITDDWKLIDDLDLDTPVGLIRGLNYDYVRLGPIHAGLRGVTRYTENLEYFLELEPSYGGFCFATRPFLCRPRFFEVVGSFAELKDAYDTERDYSDRINYIHHRNLKLAFAGLFDTRSLWEHIGDVSPVGHIQLT